MNYPNLMDIKRITEERLRKQRAVCQYPFGKHTQLSPIAMVESLINSFLEDYNLAGKTIVLFATSGGSGFGNTLEKLEDSCRGAILKEGKILNGHLNKDELTVWVKEITE